MQCKWFVVATLAFSVPSGLHAQTSVNVPSISLYTLQQSMGVSTHVNYTDGNYANYQAVIADLNYLGVANVRDTLPNPGYDAPNAETGRRALAAAGIHFDFLSTCSQSVAVEMAGLDEYASQFPGSVLAVEGTNEINNAPCPGNTQAAALSNQRALYQAVHADANLKDVPVLDFTGGAQGSETGSLAGQADALNTHPYPADGQMPYARLASDFKAVYGANFGKMASQITETGYQSFNFGANGQQGEDELSRAEMLGDEYFDSVLEGNTHTYLYQLLQAYTNVEVNPDTAYGLFDVFNRPSLFAQFLHNMRMVLPADVASPQKSVQATVYGTMPATAHMLATTTSSTYARCPSCVLLWSWNEAPEFNTTTHENVFVEPQSGFVQMAGYTAVGIIFPAYDSPVAAQAAGTANGAPYFRATLWGFPTAMVFKPIASGQTARAK